MGTALGRGPAAIKDQVADGLHNIFRCAPAASVLLAADRILPAAGLHIRRVAGSQEDRVLHAGRSTPIPQQQPLFAAELWLSSRPKTTVSAAELQSHLSLGFINAVTWRIIIRFTPNSIFARMQVEIAFTAVAGKHASRMRPTNTHHHHVSLPPLSIGFGLRCSPSFGAGQHRLGRSNMHHICSGLT